MRRALLVLVAAALLGGCGDGGETGAEAGTPSPAARPAGPSQAPVFTCRDWTAADGAGRDEIVTELERAFGRTTRDGQTGATVPREQAVAQLDRACGESFAANFRLWKLYERAVAFG